MKGSKKAWVVPPWDVEKKGHEEEIRLWVREGEVAAGVGWGWVARC